MKLESLAPTLMMASPLWLGFYLDTSQIFSDHFLWITARIEDEWMNIGRVWWGQRQTLKSDSCQKNYLTFFTFMVRPMFTVSLSLKVNKTPDNIDNCLSWTNRFRSSLLNWLKADLWWAASESNDLIIDWHWSSSYLSLWDLLKYYCIRVLGP